MLRKRLCHCYYSVALNTGCLFLLIVSASGQVGTLIASQQPTEMPLAGSRSTLNVTKLADTNDGICDTDCSLREALSVAAPGDTIGFASDLTGTITLHSTLIIDRNATINGPGIKAMTISGHNDVRVFFVDSGVHFTIIRLTIADGRIKGNSGKSAEMGENGGDGLGGGLYNNGGTVTIVDSTFSDNSAVGGKGGFGRSVRSGGTGGDGLGAGLFNNKGTVTIVNSTFSGNSAVGGGGGGPGGEGGKASGGALFSTGLLFLVNSTLSGNSAEGGSGGDAAGANYMPDNIPGNGGHAWGGAIYSTINDAWLSNCTLTGNKASGGTGGWGRTITTQNNVVLSSSPNGAPGDGLGGAIYRPGAISMKSKLVISRSGKITIRNTLIADSSSGGNCEASIVSEGYNIDSDGTCGLSSSGDLSKTDPKLGPLKNNGGPTFTHALLPGSPAIDAGNPAGCIDHNGAAIATDQRGRSRSGRCDIGAFEFSP